MDALRAMGRADGAIGDEARGEETPTPSARNLIKSYCAKSRPLLGSPKSITSAPHIAVNDTRALNLM